MSLLVILRRFGVFAVAKGFKKNLQPKKRKREKRLVNPADHNTSIFLPVLGIAIILQCRTHVPGQKAPADSPDQGKEAINRNVEIRSKANAAVQDDSHGQRRDGKERRCHELLLKVSMTTAKFQRRWQKYQYKSPRRLPVIVRQVPHEEAHNATNDKTREKLEEPQ